MNHQLWGESAEIQILSNYKQIDSDKLQGFIRIPSVLELPVVRGFSGSIQTLPTVSMFSNQCFH